MHSDRFDDQGALLLRHPVEIAGEIHPPEHRVHQREREQLVIHAGVGICPVARLLRQDAGRRRGRNRCVQHRVLLVGGRLHMQPREGGIVHPHRARRATLDEESRMTALDVVEPVEQCARVTEQPLARGEPTPIGARARHGVVVHLEEADAVISDQADRPPRRHGLVPPDGAGRADAARARPPAHRAVRRTPRREACWQAASPRRSPPVRARDPAPSRAAGCGRAPLRGRRGIGWAPAAIHRRSPTSYLLRSTSLRRCRNSRRRVCGRVDQWQQLLGGRIAHQRVHVVVEHDRQRCVGVTRQSNGAPLIRQGSECAIQPLPCLPTAIDPGTETNPQSGRTAVDH